MTIIKRSNAKGNYPSIVEDPRTSTPGFYFFGDRHDKSTLSPVYDKYLAIWSVGATPINVGFGIQVPTNTGVNNGHLLSKKPSTSVTGNLIATNNNTNTNWLDPSAWFSMTSSVQPGNIYEVTGGGYTSVIAFTTTASTQCNLYLWNQLTSTQHLSDRSRSLVLSSSTISYPIVLGLSQDNLRIVGIGYAASGSSFGPTYCLWSLGANTSQQSWPDLSSTSTPWTATNRTGNNSVQHLGVSSVDNSYLMVETNKGTTTAGVTCTISKVVWNANTPTVTQLANFATVPTASGTSAGGNNLNNHNFWKNCSSWFTDPRTSNTRAFYFPYFDSNRDFHPFVITWNTTNDTFQRETDITIVGNKSSVVADLSNRVTNDSTFAASAINCETFVSGGTRYVMFLQIDARGEQYNGVPGCRTWVVYSVGDPNIKTLTYHSALILPETPINYVWLSDNQTIIGVFMNNSFRVYTWSNSGWANTTTYNFRVIACGRDSLDRIWYVSADPEYGNTVPRIGIITPSAPVNINIVPELTSYEYAGTNINTYVTVEALSVTGTRLVTDVKLVIEGGSMTFSDSTVVKTITTSSSATVQVNLIITSSGFSNIIASVEL